MKKRCNEWKSATETLSSAVFSSEVQFPGSRFISDERCDGQGPFKICDEDDVVDELDSNSGQTSCVYRKGKFLFDLS